MTPTLSTIAALRRAVLLDPHDDTARLVLADALDEHGDPMQAKWAALIRCQIEMVGLSSTDRTCPFLDDYGMSKPRWEEGICQCRGCVLTRLESALLRDLTPWLRRGERCERCKGKGMLRKRATRLGGEEHRCPTCHGTGWLGSLVERRVVESVYGYSAEYDFTIPATFSRGLVSRVELTAAQVQDAAFMARLFAEWPVTEAGLVGKRSGSTSFGWWNPNQSTLSDYDSIPSAVWERLNNYELHPGRDSRYKWYPTAEAANAALSRAIVALGRAAAGLPQIGVAS